MARNARTAARDGLTPQQLADRTAAQFDAMGTALSAGADDVVRTTQPRHHAAPVSSGPGWRRRATFIFPNIRAGIPSATKLFLTSPNLPRDRAAAVSHRPARLSSGRGGELLFQTFSLSGPAPQALSRRSGFCDAGKISQRNYRLRRTGVDRSVDQPFDLRLGHSGSRRYAARHVCLGRCIDEFLTGTGFPDPAAPRAKFWPASVHVIGKDITRFHAIYWPAFLMSARVALASPNRRPWFSVQPRRENVEVGWNVIDPLALARHYALISCVIFCCVKCVWPGWHLFARSYCQSDQCRSCQ